METEKPFFSICVTTYNRNEYLKECLESIMAQTFSDFEVLVGNDYQPAAVNASRTGFDDVRIRYFNHEKNLGEIGNMNFMLSQSKGRYLTLLADDDLYSPFFLKAAYDAIIKHNNPECIYSSYEFFHDNQRPDKKKLSLLLPESVKIPGVDFTVAAISGRLKVIGSMGFFRNDYIRKLGGYCNFIDKPGAFSFYGEYMFLINASENKLVSFINAPLVYYRAQLNPTWKPCIDTYRVSAREFLRKSFPLLTSGSLARDFQSNVYYLLNLFLMNQTMCVLKTGNLSGLTFLKEIIYTDYSEIVSKTEFQSFFKRAQRNAKVIVFFRMIIPVIKELLDKKFNWLYLLLKKIFRKH